MSESKANWRKYPSEKSGFVHNVHLIEEMKKIYAKL